MSDLPIMSAADRRGFAWMTAWVALGFEMETDAAGNLEMSHNGSPEALMLLDKITDPLLAHAVGRCALNYFQWAQATGNLDD